MPGSIGFTGCENSALVVILSEAKNPSRLKTKDQEGFFAQKIGAQNDSFPLFSAGCSACVVLIFAKRNRTQAEACATKPLRTLQREST